jgi:hypothetical protein
VAGVVLLVVVSGCATAPSPRRAAVPALRVVEAGKVDLQQARVLLEKARPELEPRQWELLNGKLLAAEQARELYESLRPKGAPTGHESGSPALGLVGGVGSAVEGASVVSILVLLAAVWATSTVGPEMDPPKWQGAHQDYDARLRELSEVAEKVRLEVEASRGGRRKAATGPPRPPEVHLFLAASSEVKGGLPWQPCERKGTGGPGPSKPGPQEWVLCRYQCGRYEVEFYIPGKLSERCQDRWNLDMAGRYAMDAHR